MLKRVHEPKLIDARLGALLVLSCVLAVRAAAQVPVTGIPTRDCLQLAHPAPAASHPLLFGFHWQSPDRDPAAPDVLFDESYWTPHDGDGPAPWYSVISATGWGIHPNWRLPQTGVSIIDVVVLGEGELWLDSGPITVPAPDFTLVRQQAIGSLGGNSPDVTTDGDRHRIRWKPLIELDDTHDAMDCSPAGAAPRGFVRGYIVWSLPVSAFAAPTPHDFLRFGSRTLVDLATLDFTVIEPDGSTGSDLDSTDGLILINPDGAPDTGDEILDLEVCTEGGLARWYAVQPVVKGNFSYYDGGTSGVLSAPGALVDVNADGIPDVADILVDGLHEFSDACGLGLGLLWQGGIATSTIPGLGDALASPPACGAVGECARGSRNPGVAGVRGPYEPSAVDLRNVEPLTMRPNPAGMLVVGWEETLGDKDALYIGHLETLVRGRRYDHEPLDPCMSPGPPAIVPMPTFNAYFLVTHWDYGLESSRGRDSFGRERPAAATPCR